LLDYQHQSATAVFLENTTEGQYFQVIDASTDGASAATACCFRSSGARRKGSPSQNYVVTLRQRQL
jgi:hypothetical protein